MDQGIREFVQAGLLAEEHRLYIASSDAYFKALVHATDHHLFMRYGKFPDNHAERFRMLQPDDEELYAIISGLFNVYRKSYRDTITYADLVRIKNGLKRALALTGLEKEFAQFLSET